MWKASRGRDFNIGCDNRTRTVMVDGMIIGVVVGIIINGGKELLKKHGYLMTDTQDSTAKGGQESISGSASARKSKQDKESKGKKAKSNKNTDAIIQVATDALAYGFFFALAAPLMDFLRVYLKVVLIENT